MNNKPTVVVPSDPKKREEMIFALEWQLTQDTNEKRQRNSPRCAGKIKSCQVEKSPPKRWAFFISVSRDERQVRTYTPFRCVRKNPEGALRVSLIPCAAARILPFPFGH